MNQVLEKTDKNVNKLNIKEIVVAVDLSPHSEKTAAYAAKFAKTCGAAMTLVHAFAPEPITEFTTQEVHETYREEEREAKRALGRLANRVREAYGECGYEFRIGDPAEEVTLVAKDLDADLIVTASHHPHFLSRLFGLDQAPRILHKARCPVLVYHEEKELAEA